jgi:hypothetical protein
MNLNIIKGILIIFFLMNILILNAQEKNFVVSITTSGYGKTTYEAGCIALQSAIKQTFSAFIVLDKNILDNSMIVNQIISLTKDEIIYYSILNETQFPDGNWVVDLKIRIFVNKLIEFLKTNGIIVNDSDSDSELTKSIKEDLFNEQAEIKIIYDMIGFIHHPMQLAFDYSLEIGTPNSLDEESKNWSVPFTIKATSNKNIDLSANYLINTLLSISLKEPQVNYYKLHNKQVYKINIFYKNVENTFYLRKQSSFNLIKTLINQWEFYINLFKIQSGENEYIGKCESKIHEFKAELYLDNELTVNFPRDSQIVGAFSYNDKLTIQELNQKTNYKVKKLGIISKFDHGGFVVSEENGHGFVVSIFDLGNFNWGDAKKACEDFNMSSFYDWRLPSILELKDIFEKLGTKGIGNFNGYYWSSYKIGNGMYDWVRFSQGVEPGHSYDNKLYVRAVRNF